MDLIGRLNRIADLYCATRSLRREQLSYQVFRDQRRLDGVFSRRSGLTVASFEGAMFWLSANWPAEADWPADIERPAVAEQVAP